MDDLAGKYSAMENGCLDGGSAREASKGLSGDRNACDAALNEECADSCSPQQIEGSVWGKGDCKNCDEFVRS